MKTALKVAFTFTALAVLISLSAGNAFAQRHPAYLRALSDLRAARAHLERPDGGALRDQERKAIGDINHAIDEIVKAAIRDGKDPDFRPHVDLPRDWAGRLHRAMELLNRAYNDIDREEDNGFAQGLRSRALGHISHARQHVREAMDIIHYRYE